MADTNKFDRTTPPQRPPPIPPQKGGAAAGARLAKAKAWLEIRRLRAASWIRGHKLAAAAVAAAVVVVGAGAIAVAFDAVPSFGLFAPKTLAEARANARSHPRDPGAQRELGHVLFAAKQRTAAVAAYRHALARDATIADDRMIENLVACFGTRDQDEAEALLWKNKLEDAQKRLEPLVSSRSSPVRWGAVQTLDRLKVGKLSNWETAYLLDLDSASCDVKRRAVEKLGEIGTKRAVKALRAAKAADEKTDGWFSSPCLGDRLQDAERQILARR